MPIKRYSAVLATEHPMPGRRYAYNREDDKFEVRVYEAKLTVDNTHLFAKLDTPNGVPVLWSHQSGVSFWSDGSYVAIGRVEKLEFSGKKLMGVLALKEELVNLYIPDGFASIESGINSGLSMGLQYLEKTAGTWTIRDGTPEKPDLFRFGKTNILETSLTPMPRIPDAGILEALQDDNKNSGGNGGKMETEATQVAQEETSNAE